MNIIFKVFKWIGVLVGLLLILITIGFTSFSTSKRLPKPAGKYDVGVTYRTIQTKKIDDSSRNVYLKIWYPAATGNNKKKKRAPYIEGGKETGEKLLEDPVLWQRLAIKKITRLKTNAYVDIPLAEGSFPLVTYSHGFGMWASDNTTLMESLASKGFVVVSISHLENALFAPKSENEIVLPKKEHVEEQVDTALQRKHREKYFTLKTQEELNAYHLEGRKFSSGKDVKIWSDDIVAAINYMKNSQELTDDFFFQKIDTSKIGAIGFSFGGNAALNATLKDADIDVAVNMDGGLSGDFYEMKPDLDTEILLLTGLRTLPASNDTISHYGNFTDKNGKHYPTLMISGAQHANFTDINHISVLLKWFGILGKVNRKFANEQKNLIVYDFLNASFNQSKFDPNHYEKEDKVLNFKYE